MNRVVGYEWHLADLVHRHRLSATSDLRRLLAERGVELSGTHAYRLVTPAPGADLPDRARRALRHLRL